MQFIVIDCYRYQHIVKLYYCILLSDLCNSLKALLSLMVSKCLMSIKNPYILEFLKLIVFCQAFNLHLLILIN